jgi:hypothetical protein
MAECQSPKRWSARADWLAAQRLLNGPGTQPTRPGRAKHLMSLIAGCVEVRDQLAAARTRHEELADAVAAGTLSVTLATRSEPAQLAPKVLQLHIKQ